MQEKEEDNGMTANLGDSQQVLLIPDKAIMSQVKGNGMTGKISEKETRELIDSLPQHPRQG